MATSDSDVRRYSELAHHLLNMAAEANNVAVRAQLIMLAAQYQELIRHACVKRDGGSTVPDLKQAAAT